MTNDGKRIKALDDKGQPRAVIGYGLWNSWRSPAEWTRDRIATLGHRPGVYMLRSIHSTDKPVEFPLAVWTDGSGAAANDLTTRAHSLQGVLYIGKAIDLIDRFGLLVKSWQTDPPTPGHTSAKNYFGKDVGFQQHFPASKVELTCKSIGSKDWTDAALADGLLGISQDWFWEHYPQWTQGHGSSQMDQTVAAAIENERALLCLYRKVFGKFPPLNVDTPKDYDAQLDQEWLDLYLKFDFDPAKYDPEADAKVEMGALDSPEVRKLIAEDRQKREQSDSG